MSKKIRIKHAKGTKVLTFTGTTELGLLKAIIEEETGIPSFSQKRKEIYNLFHTTPQKFILVLFSLITFLV